MQCDNAGGENKNKYVFGVLALFVLLGWFEIVELHMLLKGHTHDIEDAAFGTFHEVVYGTGSSAHASLFIAPLFADFVFTFADVAAAVQQHYHDSTRPTLAVVDNVLNFKSFLDGCLNNDIHNHTGMLARANTGGPRAFKFSKLPDGNVGMVYKEFAGEDAPWAGVADKSAVATLAQLPTEPWRVFTQLPTLGTPIPGCDDPVRIPRTLDGDLAALKQWFKEAEQKEPEFITPSLCDSVLSWFNAVKDEGKLLAKSTADRSAQPVAVGSGRIITPTLSADPVTVRHVAGDPFVYGTLPPQHATGHNPHAIAAADRKKAKHHPTADQKLPPTIIVVNSIEQPLTTSPVRCDGGDGVDVGAGAMAVDSSDASTDTLSVNYANSAHQSRCGKRKQRDASSSDASEPTEAQSKRQRSVTVTDQDADLFSTLTFEQVRVMKRVEVVARVAHREERIWRVGTLTPNQDARTFTVTLYQLPGVVLTDVPPCRFRRPSRTIAVT